MEKVCVSIIKDTLVLINNKDYLVEGVGSFNLKTLPNSTNKVTLKNICGEVNIEVGEHSCLILDSISLEKSTNRINITLNEASDFSYTLIATKQYQEDFNVTLAGYQSTMNAKYLCISKEFDSLVNCKVVHHAKQTYSNIENYGVAISNGEITYNTIGKIERGYSGSVCKQMTRGIIAGEKAAIKSLPILLIDEYDVKANHGTAIGKMSDEELFYLMSRGLNKEDAFKLILSGIVNPIVKSLQVEQLQEEVLKEIYSKI